MNRGGRPPKGPLGAPSGPVCAMHAMQLAQSDSQAQRTMRQRRSRDPAGLMKQGWNRSLRACAWPCRRSRGAPLRMASTRSARRRRVSPGSQLQVRITNTLEHAATAVEVFAASAASAGPPAASARSLNLTELPQKDSVAEEIPALDVDKAERAFLLHSADRDWGVLVGVHPSLAPRPLRLHPSKTPQPSTGIQPLHRLLALPSRSTCK